MKTVIGIDISDESKEEKIPCKRTFRILPQELN